MCGIVGIVGQSSVNQTIYDALTVLQHRGQDAAGIVTIDRGAFRLRKANGLVKDVLKSNTCNAYKVMQVLAMCVIQLRAVQAHLKRSLSMLTRHLGSL